MAKGFDEIIPLEKMARKGKIPAVKIEPRKVKYECIQKYVYTQYCVYTLKL